VDTDHQASTSHNLSSLDFHTANCNWGIIIIIIIIIINYYSSSSSSSSSSSIEVLVLNHYIGFLLFPGKDIFLRFVLLVNLSDPSHLQANYSFSACFSIHVVVMSIYCTFISC
jgi:hypothetical protein